MTSEVRLLPGPAAKYASTEDLFTWMNENFYTFGDIYKAMIFGSNVYVVSNPVYCEHILRWNWRNYTRSGQIVKRICLVLGKGLIGSNGELWASQRRMIQPAFTKTSIGGMIPLIISANADLLEKWKTAAVRHESVNVTFDLSCMVLRITLVSIFGDDYPIIAQHFEIFSENSERNLDIAQPVRLLKELIVRIAAERRRDGKVAKDFLGILMEARDRDKGQPMPDAQLANEVMTLVIAGHETTANILNWIWWLLSRYPEVQTKLSVELDRPRIPRHLLSIPPNLIKSRDSP
jgi:cytochrome P450